MRKAWLFSLMLLPAVASSQTTVYSNNFESGSAGSAFSGAGAVQSTGGLSAFGFGSNHLRNEGSSSTVLSLSGLGTHTSMTLNFSLAMWDSIDWGDIFVVRADGADLFNASFGNYGTPSDQCEGPGTRLTAAFSDFVTPNYGFGFNRDCARGVSFTFAHSASNVAFSWAYPGTQGGADESFGIDDVVVQTNAVITPGTTVPEPSTYAMMAAGLAAVLVVRRKQRA